MPQRLQPIDTLDREWAVIGRSADARHAITALADAEPEVAALGCRDLGDLVRVLRTPQAGAGRVRSARLVQLMLRSAGVHPLVARAILQAVVPGLVGVARRLAWGNGGDWVDGGAFFSDLLATAWEVVADWSGDDRQYAVLDLLSAVRCRARRQMVHQRVARERAAIAIDADERLLAAPDAGVSGLDQLARVLDELAGHGLDPADAAVVYGHRVLGLSMAELAQLTGKTRRHLDTRRLRAEQALCV